MQAISVGEDPRKNVTDSFGQVDLARGGHRRERRQCRADHRSRMNGLAEQPQLTQLQAAVVVEIIDKARDASNRLANPFEVERERCTVVGRTREFDG